MKMRMRGTQRGSKQEMSDALQRFTCSQNVPTLRAACPPVQQGIHSSSLPAKHHTALHCPGDWVLPSPPSPPHLLPVHRVCLVEHDADLAGVAAERSHDPLELVADVELVGVEEEEDEVRLGGEPLGRRGWGRWREEGRRERGGGGGDVDEGDANQLPHLKG